MICTDDYSSSMWKSHLQRVLVHVHIARKCGAKYHPCKCPTCTRRHHGMLPNAQQTHGNVPAHNETLHVYPPFQSWLHRGGSPTPALPCTASAHVPKSMLNGCRSHVQEVMLHSLGQTPTQCTSCSVYDTWLLQDVHISSGEACASSWCRATVELSMEPCAVVVRERAQKLVNLNALSVSCTCLEYFSCSSLSMCEK
jgi:hypothetical protein